MAEDVVGHLGMFRRRYPELSRLLIDVREEYMAVRVKNLLDGSVGVVVVVVGLGHLRGLAKRLVAYGDGSVKGGFSVGASWTVGTYSWNLDLLDDILSGWRRGSRGPL